MTRFWNWHRRLLIFTFAKYFFTSFQRS